MNENERARFHALRLRELAGEPLTPEETGELAGYIAAIEAEEADALHASQEERARRIAVLDKRITEMRSLVARREALAQHLRRVQQEVDAECEAIDTAFRQLLTQMEPAANSLAATLE